MSDPDKMHKSMVGELFIVFLVYLYFFFKYPKKYVNDDHPDHPQNQAENKQAGQQNQQGIDHQDVGIQAGGGRTDQRGKQVPGSSIQTGDKDVKFTDRLLVYFTHHTIAVGAAVFAPFAFETTITWLHLPVYLLYVFCYQKGKITLAKICLILMYLVNICLILAAVIERHNGFVIFATKDYLNTNTDTSGTTTDTTTDPTTDTSTDTNSTEGTL